MSTVSRSVLHRKAKDLFDKDEVSELSDNEKHDVALRLLYECFPYGVSTGIHEEVTYGYGDLDANGFWELPLSESDVKKMRDGKL